MCGVIGVIGAPESAKEVFLGLITLQHRGQDAAGILSYSFSHSDSDRSFRQVKNLGLVENVFSQQAIEQLQGTLAIGHTRYSTVGRGELEDVQPLMVNYPYGIGVVHNGNIVNHQQLKERLSTEMRTQCLTRSDTETLLNWFAQHLEGTGFEAIEKAVQSVFESVQGSYSVVGVLGDSGLFAFRDTLGIRPLVLGKKSIEGKTAYMVASESVALHFLGYTFERDISPGEVIFIDQKQKLHSKVLVPASVSPRPCMFEWVYFASAESEMEGAPIYGTRLELGIKLADLLRSKIASGEIEADLVAAVPDTSRTAASALAEALQIPYREVLIKNRYIKRTFILSSQQLRQSAVDLKLNPVISEIKGKNIILVDDSIVRGTTSKKIVDIVKRAGAKKVTFVSTCPPIRFPCFYGIDFPNPTELIASDKTEKQIAQELGCENVIYQTLDGLKDSLKKCSGGKVKNPCTACLDGQYPTSIKESQRFAQLREKDRKGVSS